MKSRHSIGFGSVFVLAGLLMVGCSPASSTKKTTLNSPAVPEEKSLDAEKSREPESTEVAHKQLEVVPSIPDVSEKLAMSESANDVKVPSMEDMGVIAGTEELKQKDELGQWSWYRYGLLLDDGPILIDFVMREGLQGLLPSKEHRQSEVRQLLDDDGTERETSVPTSDQELAWTEVLAHRMVRGRVFANLQAEDEQRGQDLIRQYDRNGDGKADAKELHAFLTRGLSERPVFVLDEASEYRGVNRDESPLFLRLDTDGNSALSSEEVSQIAERMSLLDRNGDRVISLDEVRAPTQDRQAYMRRRQNSASNLAIPIYPASKRRFEAEILDRYEISDGIDRESWLAKESLFKSLDSDADSRLSAGELGGVLRLPPDLTIRVDWEKVPGLFEPSRGEGIENAPESGQGRFQLFEQERVVSQGVLPGLWRWEKPKIRLRIRIRDPLSQQSLDTRVAQTAEALGVTVDRPQTIVAGLAAGPSGVTAAGMDRNQDEKLTWEEVKWSVRAKATLTSELVRVRLVEIPDSWFTWLDQDWDDVLSESEIENSPRRISELFSASDSDLAPESLPVQLDVLVTRTFGDEDPFSMAFFESAAAPSPDSKPLPDWFRAMDCNGDGIVARREFLGRDESMKTLDRDHNGWLDASDFD